MSTVTPDTPSQKGLDDTQKKIAAENAENAATDVAIINSSGGAGGTDLALTRKPASLMDEVLNDPLAKYNEFLKEVMKSDQCRRQLNGNICIHLNNCKDVLKFDDTEGKEVIYIKGASIFRGMSDEAADAAMKLAANRGWTSVEIKGPQKKKEQLWYAAKMNGLDVSNFQPDKGSEIYQKLQDSLAAREKEAAQNAVPQAEDSKFLGDSSKTEAPSTAAPEAPKSEEAFKTWLHEKAETAPTKEAREGLKKIAEALDKGLNVGDTEKTVFMDKYESALVDLKGKPTGGYNNVVPMIEQMAQVQKIDLSLPKIPEAAAPQIILPPSAKNKNPEP